MAHYRLILGRSNGNLQLIGVKATGSITEGKNICKRIERQGQWREILRTKAPQLAHKGWRFSEQTKKSRNYMSTADTSSATHASSHHQPPPEATFLSPRGRAVPCDFPCSAFPPLSGFCPEALFVAAAAWALAAKPSEDISPPDFSYTGSLLDVGQPHTFIMQSLPDLPGYVQHQI